MITQVIQVNEIGPSSELGYFSHIFDPFDVALGTLTEVSLRVDASVDILLDQFQCSLGPEACTIEFATQSIFTTGSGAANQLGGRDFRPSEYTGWVRGDQSNITEWITAGFPSLGLGPIEGFHTAPLRYQVFSEWYCRSCDSIQDPLLFDFQLYGELTYEFTPTSIPLPSTLLLSSLAAFALRKNRRSAVEVTSSVA